jgi:hypothetical protein
MSQNFGMGRAHARAWCRTIFRCEYFGVGWGNSRDDHDILSIKVICMHVTGISEPERRCQGRHSPKTLHKSQGTNQPDWVTKGSVLEGALVSVPEA